MIPFTKPASPVIWVRPYHQLSIDSLEDGKVIVKKASNWHSIEKIGRFLGVAVALCLIVVPLILAGWNVLENAVNSDEETDPSVPLTAVNPLNSMMLVFCAWITMKAFQPDRLKQQKSISSLNLIGVGLRNSVGLKPAMW